MNPIVWAIWSLNIIQDCSSNMSSSSSKMVISRWGFAIFCSCSIYLHKVHVLNLNATFKCSFAIHYNLTNVTIISIDCAGAKCATSPALDATWTGNWKSNYKTMAISWHFNPSYSFSVLRTVSPRIKSRHSRRCSRCLIKYVRAPIILPFIFDGFFSPFTFEPTMIYIQWSLGNSFSSTYVVENRKQEGKRLSINV